MKKPTEFVEPNLELLDPFLHKRFWDFIALNEISSVEIFEGWEASDKGKYYLYARKRFPKPGRPAYYVDKKIIFKTLTPLSMEELMLAVVGGVQITNRVYFKKNYPIKKVP